MAAVLSDRFSVPLEFLQLIVDKFAKASRLFGLTISLGKTEVLLQSAHATAAPSPSISIDGTRLKTVEDFKYLGITISSNGALDKEISARICKANKALGRLHVRVLNQHNIQQSTKMKVYEAAVLSNLLYGYETWTLYRRHLKLLELFHMSSLGWCLSTQANHSRYTTLIVPFTGGWFLIDASKPTPDPLAPASPESNNSSGHMRQSGAQQCFAGLGARATLDTAVYCNATWDTVLCWPATLPNETIWLPCPALHGLDTSKFAFRHCGPEGVWRGREPGDYSNPHGYSFYGGCYTQESKGLMEKFRHLQHIKEVTGNARTLEIVGLCVSLVSTILSLLIFCYFRSLRCHRTRIHKNLFVAIIVQIAMRIVICVDQYIARKTGGEVAGATSGSSGALYDTPIFCEILYALLEYTKTVKFMWMFVEGLYLHNMIAVAFFSGKPNYLLFYSMGWGIPVVVLTAWVVPMTQSFKVKCWFAYYYTPLIWILEVPRAAVMVVNLGFLLNIIRVLVMKLRESHTNEAKKVRKAVKAAIILLPLLGLTNFVIMLEPAGDHVVLFSVWIFSAHFLTDFEGFFISLIYCFLNGEVQSALRRHIFRHMPRTYSMDMSTTHWRNTTVKVRSALARHLEMWKQNHLLDNSSFRRLSRSLSALTSFTDIFSVSQSQKSNGQAVVTETNGAPRQAPTGTSNGQTSNGRTTMPLLRLASRPFNSLRRTSARDSPGCNLRDADPLRPEHMQEQEI